MLTQKQTLIAGAVMGLLGVALGAFGAHALKPQLVAAGRLDTYELAVRYQFYHALALLAVGILMQQGANNFFQVAAALFVSGVVLFSGSLYMLALTTIKQVAFLTPVGGLLLLGGWGALLAGILKK